MGTTLLRQLPPNFEALFLAPFILNYKKNV